jgi:hypothetical protein
MERRMATRDRVLRALFWIALLCAYGAALLPDGVGPAFPRSGAVLHTVAFLTLSLLAALGWRRASLMSIGLALAGFGALIEFTQMIPALHRSADLKDWITDVGALAIGLLIAACLRPLLNRREGI